MKNRNFQTEEDDIEKDTTYVKQPRLDQMDDVLFKFKKPLYPRDILKLLVRKKVKEENEDNMKWLITSKPYSLENVNVDVAQD